MPNVEIITTTLRAVLVLATLAAGGITIFGYLGRYWWVFDIFSHFRVQYLLILITITIIALLLNELLIVGIAVIFGLGNGFAILPLYKRKKQGSINGGKYRVFMANVLRQNTSYPQVRELIQGKSPDFVILIETNGDWIEGIRAIEPDYPYRIHADRDDNYGLSLFSRIAPLDSDVIPFGDANVPSIVARFDINGETLTIVCTHPPPPKGRLNSQYRNQQLGDIAEFVQSQDGHVCVCGDLNMTPWSPYFKDLLENGGLKNSAVGFGIQPTWPVRMPIFRVPIDHCLVSSGIWINHRAIGPDIGSDHFPLLLDFSIGTR